jgi:hypothetical protein
VLNRILVGDHIWLARLQDHDAGIGRLDLIQFLREMR